MKHLLSLVLLLCSIAMSAQGNYSVNSSRHCELNVDTELCTSETIEGAIRMHIVYTEHESYVFLNYMDDLRILNVIEIVEVDAKYNDYFVMKTYDASNDKLINIAIPRISHNHFLIINPINKIAVKCYVEE